MICDKKVPTKMKLLINQTVIRPMLLYDCESWPMSEKHMTTTTEIRMVRWATGGEPVGTPMKLGDLGGSNCGTNCDGHEKKKVGMVRAR